MKKSQLRNIIRESIKELMNEQNPNEQACIDIGTTYNQQASNQIGQAGAAGFPFTGRPGITPQFVANMTGKSPQFYTQRLNALFNKQRSLQSTNISLCNGENPMWRAKLFIKQMYVYHCQQNPGAC